MSLTGVALSRKRFFDATQLHWRVLAWLFGAAVVLCVGIAKAPVYPVSDSAVFEYFGQRMLHGATLYRDIWDNKLPPIYLVNELYQAMFGEHYVFHKLAEAVIALCSTALFSIFLRAKGIVAWPAATFVFAIFEWGIPANFNTVPNYALPLLLLAFIIENRGFAVPAGVLVAAATSFWPPVILCIVPLVLTPQRARSRAALASATAAALGILAITMIVTFGRQSSIELLRSWLSYVIHAKDPQGSSSARTVARALRLGLIDSGVGALVPLCALKVARPRTTAQTFALWWALAALAAAATSLHFFMHYFIIAIPALIMVLFTFPTRGPRLVRILAVLISLLLATFTLITIPRTVLGLRRESHALRDIGMLIRRNFGDGRVLAQDNKPEIYLPAHALPPSPFAIEVVRNNAFFRSLGASHATHRADLWLFVRQESEKPPGAVLCWGQAPGWRVYVRRSLLGGSSGPCRPGAARL